MEEQEREQEKDQVTVLPAQGLYEGAWPKHTRDSGTGCWDSWAWRDLLVRTHDVTFSSEDGRWRVEGPGVASVPALEECELGGDCEASEDWWRSSSDC